MKLSNIISVAGLFALAGIAGVSAAGVSPQSVGDVCSLIENLGGVFRTLRTLCFVGAAFILLAWGWEFIKGGWDSAKGLDDVKKKGVGLLIGFTLLFSVVIVMQFMPNMGGCLQTNW
jgi:hypothetical protein